MVDELVEAARLCEEKGFEGPATALLVAADSLLKTFVVSERVPVPHPWQPAPKQVLPADGVPRALFLYSEPATRYATAHNARMLRHRNLLNYMTICQTFSSYCSTLKVAEFEARVGEILGRSFHLKLKPRRDLDRVGDLPPMFPSGATDDQMEQIADLFTFSFFVVEEIEFTR